MRRSVALCTSTYHRRRWEQRVASVLKEHKEEEVDSVSRRFNRIYKEKAFTPLADAFPSMMMEEQQSASSSSSAPSSPARAAAAMDMPENPRVLRASFLGPQNAGKTSLVNALALSNVGAVSSRYGSTKDWTTAVATVHDTQLVLLDTPGAVIVQNQRDRRRFAESTSRAWDALFVADLAVLTLPVGLGFVEAEYKRVAREVVRRAAARDLPVVLAMTMMDRVQSPRHRELYFSLRTDLESMNLPVALTHETSVKGATGLVELKDILCRYARPGPWEYARREVSDLNPADRVAELLRQSFLELLPHEIPHRMHHRIIGWTQKESGTTEVVVEAFFDRPAYLFTFYSKLEAICLRSQEVTERELKRRFRFVFQAFITPGGIGNH